MIEIDIVTPSRKLVVGAKTAELKLPSSKGQLTVLPGHTDLLTILGVGELSFKEDGVDRRFAISYGFAEIRNDKVLVLAETAEESVEIDKDRAKTAQKKAETALSGVLEEGQFNKLQLKLQRAVVRQNVAQ